MMLIVKLILICIFVMKSGDGLLNAFVILLSSFWFYKKLIEPKYNAGDINASISGKVVSFNGKTFLEISASLKNLCSKDIPITPNRSKLKVYISQTDSALMSPQDVHWKPFVTRHAFELHDWIEASDILTDHWLVDISSIKSQLYRIELLISGKKNLCHTLTIVEWGCYKSSSF